MASPLFQFRRFSLRLLVLLLGLLGAALTTTYVLVSRENQRNAREHIERELDRGGSFYDEAVLQRSEFLVAGASLMTEDRTIWQALTIEAFDQKQLTPVLQNYTKRVGAPVIALLTSAGRLLANSDPATENENRGPFAYLIRTATQAGRTTGHDFAYLNHELHVLAVVPLYAPYPKIAGWFGLAFPLDQTFAQKIKSSTRLDVTFFSTEDLPHLRVLASTLPATDLPQTMQAAVDNMKAPERIRTLEFADGPHIALFRNQEMLGDSSVVVVLQRPLAAELAASRDLENYLILVSLGALAAATLAAFWIARGISRPVQQLAAHTRHVAAGDYTRRLDLHRADELGQLADSFNTMTAGLADRDRVRDLLGKVVSPEIAAQLLRSDVMLGGEEREVTILFSDIRNFTALSERLAPAAVLTLLNRYLDHMSRIVEQHGGVIDKYIGDAIMALFGAPVADPDAPGRALAAARAMSAALDELNRELVAEGRPALEIGIGVNTARVVAGNMGSKARLNYTVIGDGVNVASRLQSLTKEPAYASRIIVSEATVLAAHQPPSVRALGEVTVKGKTSTVKIFALV